MTETEKQIGRDVPPILRWPQTRTREGSAWWRRLSRLYMWVGDREHACCILVRGLQAALFCLCFSQIRPMDCIVLIL